MPGKHRRIAGFIPVLAAASLLASISAAEAGSANIAFSGEVPCRLAAQECAKPTREQYVFAETAGVKYVVHNGGTESRIVRPQVRSASNTASVLPASQNLAPGETGRFVVLMPMGARERQRFEVCAGSINGFLGACQRFIAVAVK